MSSSEPSESGKPSYYRYITDSAYVAGDLDLPYAVLNAVPENLLAVEDSLEDLLRIEPGRGIWLLQVLPSIPELQSRNYQSYRGERTWTKFFQPWHFVLIDPRQNPDLYVTLISNIFSLSQIFECENGS